MSTLSIEQPSERVRVIRLNRPERLNALTFELTAELHDALDAFVRRDLQLASEAVAQDDPLEAGGLPDEAFQLDDPRQDRVLGQGRAGRRTRARAGEGDDGLRAPVLPSYRS